MNKARVKCPECGINGVVLSSSASEHGRSRRYSCSSGHRFTTLEVVVNPGEVTSISTGKNGSSTVSREGYDAVKKRVLKAVRDALK